MCIGLVYVMAPKASYISDSPSLERQWSPKEKVHKEVAAMRYTQAHTSIVVPFILYYGTQPAWLRPFHYHRVHQPCNELYQSLKSYLLILRN